MFVNDNDLKELRLKQHAGQRSLASHHQCPSEKVEWVSEWMQGRHHGGGGGGGGQKPPKDFEKGENEKNMGYFHASKLLKLAFLSSLTRKYMLWKGFYHDFSTKKASALGGFTPWPPPRGSATWTPTRGSAPWTPEVYFAPPPNDLPWRRPWVNEYVNEWMSKDLCLKTHFKDLAPPRTGGKEK